MACSAMARFSGKVRSRDRGSISLSMQRPVELIVSLLLIMRIRIAASAYANAGCKEVFNNTKGVCAIFVEPLGSYECREFSVSTQDGFLLGVQKLSSKNYLGPNKGPVFLYHGIMQGGDVWLLNGPRESLGFLLADAGYDTYLGNTRSSDFSYGHKIYSRTDREYWDWSWDALVDQDLPSMLQFVYDQTNEKISFVGFSQGTMTAFAAFTRTNVVSLVKKAAMLSPVAYLRHVTAPLLKVAAWLFADQVLLFAGVYRFSIESEGGRKYIDMTCSSSQLQCHDLLSLITGPNCCLNASRMAYYATYEVQSTSMKNIAQMAQEVRSGGFNRYDYGLFGNLVRYRSLFPSSYDLSAIPAELPLLLAHGGKDPLSDPGDVSDLVASLRGDPVVILVPPYAHGDFVLASNANALVYSQVLIFLDS